MRILASLAVAICLIGCGGKSGSGSSDAPTFSVEGVWKGACSSAGSNLWFVPTLTFTGDESKTQYSFYSEASCLTAKLTNRSTRTFKVVGDVSAISGAKKIDITTKTCTIVMTTADTVTEANTNKYYGISDWVLNQERDVAGKKMNDTDTDAEPAVGEVTYTIYKVDSTKLIGGDTATGDSTADAKRPTSLSSTFVLTKQ